MTHRDKKLDSLLGKTVRVTLFNEKVVSGKLGYTTDMNVMWPNCYYVELEFGKYVFRKSHVKRIEVK